MSAWDESYDTVISCSDPGEEALDGGLPYARYGKGGIRVHRLFVVPSAFGGRSRRISDLRQPCQRRQCEVSADHPRNHRVQ